MLDISKSSEQQRTCDVCWEEYTLQRKPVILVPCGHSLCEVCASRPELTDCPRCRTPRELGGAKRRRLVYNYDLLHNVIPANEMAVLHRSIQEKQDEKHPINKQALAVLCRHYPFDPDRRRDSEPILTRKIMVSESGDMKADGVWIKHLDGVKRYCNFAPRDTVRQVKDYLAERRGVHREAIRLIYKGNPMSDDHTLEAHKVELTTHRDTIHMIQQMRGDIGHFGAHSDSPGIEVLRSGLAPEGTALARQVLKQLHAPPPSRLFWSAHDVTLTTEQCDFLCRWLQLTAPVKSTSTDYQVDLTATQLRCLLGRETVRALYTAFAERTVDVVRLRRVQATGECINFHLDEAKQTMQILLTPEDQYQGGKLVYVTHDQGFLMPPRPRGVPFFHDHTIVHGLTTMTQGVRCSLFFLSL